MEAENQIQVHSTFPTAVGTPGWSDVILCNSGLEDNDIYTWVRPREVNMYNKHLNDLLIFLLQ